jgi:hypothetical protein
LTFPPKADSAKSAFSVALKPPAAPDAAAEPKAPLTFPPKADSAKPVFSFAARPPADPAFPFAAAEVSFHFGTGQTFTSRVSAAQHAFPANDPCVFVIPPAAARAAAPEEEDKNEDLKTVAFVAGRSGEEDETVIQDVTAQLYMFDGTKWTQRGVGPLHLNRGGGGRHRIVMRRDQTGTVALNAPVFAAMKPELIDSKTAHQVQFLAPLPGESAKVAPMSLKFKTSEDAERFCSAWKQAIADLRE